MIAIAPAGDRAVLVSLADDVPARELHACAAALRRVRGVIACVAGHSSVLVVCDSLPDVGAITNAGRERVDRGDESGGFAAAVQTVFSGADLGEFLERVKLSREEFLARVDGLRLTVRYLGFRGGFAYLDGWPEQWAMPRRPTSRPVKRGSFAIAGNIAGFYPIDTPGGWNILGSTDEPLEYRFTPGDEIVIAVRRPIEGIELVAAPLTIEVGATDWSRAMRGRAPGGPFDAEAAALANEAVGNAPDAPVLECAIAGPRLRATRDRVVAWCGPDGRVRVEQLSAGQEIAFGKIEGGLRGYVAVGDGVKAAALLPQSETGGEGFPRIRSDKHIIRCMRGPHDIGLSEVECEVTPKLDRVGIRLQPLRALGTPPADLKSCGMQCGTVQFHPDGSLVAMGPEHPVTGGYLQPMTVLTSERWKLAQLVPGERITLVADQPPKA